MEANREWRPWAARALIAVVLIWNLQCAVAFLVSPEGFAPSFELEGEAGAVMVRSMGILFVMWNVPYAVALWHPGRHRRSLIEALVMQCLGVVGEGLLWVTLSPGHDALRRTAWRFTLFDGAGVVLLLLALLCVRRYAPSPPSRS